jgi:sn-glycerol 3-phosphate transport system ATP-binding protein
MNLMKVYGTLDGVELMEGAGLSGGVGLPLPKDGALLGVRPEDLDLSPDGHVPAGGIALDVTVAAVEPVGAESYLYAPLGAGPDLIVRVPGTDTPAPGTRIRVVAPREKLHLFETMSGARIGDTP